ncbi:uncharacterized protein A4U43_C05F33450 [Asparagus officinalis]|uniref:Uncharacterized protein n=1 Tax=Asparagus officinalis TaxID=4686 RepID=A0A5P1EY78_ASPOF|nr:uncharacterized protein A4U43_C05F33450 [Asparagus officinalis]
MSRLLTANKSEREFNMLIVTLRHLGEGVVEQVDVIRGAVGEEASRRPWRGLPGGWGGAGGCRGEDEEEEAAVVEAAAMRMNGRGTCRLCLCRDLLCARCAKSFLGPGAATAAR